MIIKAFGKERLDDVTVGIRNEKGGFGLVGRIAITRMI